MSELGQRYRYNTQKKLHVKAENNHMVTKFYLGKYEGPDSDHIRHKHLTSSGACSVCDDDDGVCNVCLSVCLVRLSVRLSVCLLRLCASSQRVAGV